MSAPIVVFRNATVIDGTHAEPRERQSVVVEGDAIREVTDGPVTLRSGQAIDLRGRTLMPGLIDCHVHVVASLVNIAANHALPDAVATLRAVPILRGMLDRGFTTVRDAGGADAGLALAVEQGLVPGPRLFIAGKALSQTGGHGDVRGRFDAAPAPPRGGIGSLSRIVDGVDGVRKAAREELRAGARHIKVMASGGVASPTDLIGNTQFSREELRAVVEESEAAQTYVMAHAYTAPAIRRAVECGIRTVEHCNLIDDETAGLMAGRGAYAVPTLVTYDKLAAEGAALGFPPESVAKIEDVREAGLRSLEILKRAGVQMAYGTDLLGEMHRHQSEEFLIRRRVLSAFDVIRSATTVAAQALRMEGRLGVVAPGALADLLVVEGDPLEDPSLLANPEKHLLAIMRGGRFYTNRLPA